MMLFYIKLISMGMVNGLGELRGSVTENFKSLTTDEFDNVYILGNYNSSTIYVDSTETDLQNIYRE